MNHAFLKSCFAILFIMPMLFTSGCATFIARSVLKDDDVKDDESYAVYPATKIDAIIIKDGFTEGPGWSKWEPTWWQQVFLRPAMVIGGLIDMPISLVCDTVLFPYDLHRKKKKKSGQQLEPVGTNKEEVSYPK